MLSVKKNIECHRISSFTVAICDILLTNQWVNRRIVVVDHSRNDMSYRRNGAAGIIGKDYVLRVKMQYLVDFLKESEGNS